MPPIALITGASRGIGLAITKALAPTHILILTGRDDQALASVAADLKPHAIAAVSTIAADLGQPDSRAELLACVEALAHNLGAPVQVLVNNAGLAGSAPLQRSDDAMLAELLAVNLAAPFALTRALVPGMLRAGSGRVISIASTAALKGYAYTAAYSASKAGLLGWTRALAVELAAKAITVNAVCPGFTDTAIVDRATAQIANTTGRSPEDARKTLAKFSPQGRLRSPAEVADLVAYLASPAAAGITGQALAIDGGETA